MILSLLITVLALVDGYIHLRLSGALFGGPGGGGPPFGGSPGDAGTFPGPPPGAPGPMSQLPLPLDTLFLWNAIGYAALVLLFWLGPAVLARRRWLIDALLIVYAVASIAAWFYVGAPNPMNLGYLSKALEIIMILALLLHLRVVTARVAWRP